MPRGIGWHILVCETEFASADSLVYCDSAKPQGRSSSALWLSDLYTAKSGATRHPHSPRGHETGEDFSDGRILWQDTLNSGSNVASDVTMPGWKYFSRHAQTNAVYLIHYNH